MSHTLDAVYDGSVFRPETTLPLDPNTRVRLVVEVLTTPDRPTSFLQTALSLDLKGPPDWSTSFDK
jgi:hypothetical protein